jgi:transcriptional regulator with XRE-family HTH domain
MATTNERIKELRLSLGYTVDEFAKVLGIHRSSVYRYEGENEKESREIPMSIAILISQKFNVSLDWLGGLSGTKHPEQSSGNLSEVYESLSEQAKKELFSFADYLKSKE